jgi:acyl carrier protein
LKKVFRPDNEHVSVKKSKKNAVSWQKIFNLLFVVLKSGNIAPQTNNLIIMSDIANRVKAIIVDKLGVDESEVTTDASFTNDLGADSLDTVELIMEFEKEFNVSIPDDQAEQIQTVGAAIQYLESNAK